ncbi:MAG: GNAT family N-acetyltransferase [Saprospiraceae bacterium]|nr:GNAT family N-acetyltransferase [Saprospiraceae bacterium]
MKFPIIFWKSERLLLREMTLNDFEDIHAYAQIPEVVQYQQWGPNSKQETMTFLRSAIAAQSDLPRLKFELGIQLHQGSFIGGCGIYLDNDNHRSAKMGYTLHPTYWNQGYATEAASGLLHWSCQTLHLDLVQATCDVENVGSRRVLEKIGMLQKEIVKDHVFQRGKWRSSYVFEHHHIPIKKDKNE